MQRNKFLQRSLFTVAGMMFSAVTAISQSPVPAPVVPTKPSAYQDPVFYALVAVAVLLLIFILTLSKVAGAVARGYIHNQKNAENNNAGTITKIGIILLAIQFIPQFMSAQVADAAGAIAPVVEEKSFWLTFLHDGFGSNAINALVAIIFIELFVVLYFSRMIRLLLIKDKELAPYIETQSSFGRLLDRFNNSVSLEEEATVATDHDYDGIRELDNALPPWWKYGFYLTIVWAIVYLFYFHVSRGGALADKEYKAELANAEIQLAEYQKKAANLVDETSVTVTKDATVLAEGKTLFTKHCLQCHGAAGEGNVGPNLTDQYWLHGGDIKDLFKTVKYGVAGKGMKSWQQELNPMMMSQVVNFVYSLRGSNPANPKAPEGNIWQEAAVSATPADTTQSAPKDTTVKTAP